MSEIYTLDSDALLLDELAEGIRNREIEQKFVYQWKWAQLYYDLKQKSDIYDEYTINIKEFVNSLSSIITKDKDQTIISLGCGNSLSEKHIFEKIIDNNFQYVWVDSSKEMLKLSIDNLKNIDINKKFLCADFSTKDFRTELQQISQWTERVFVFFSNTFWNIKHTHIIDTLWNLLNSKEKIWLDVFIRKWDKINNDIEISNMMNDFLHSRNFKKFIIENLQKYWVNLENSELIIKTEKEKLINALKFNIFLTFAEKTEIVIKWEKLTILPWESIKVQQIYAYEPQWLINFFKLHGFELLEKHTNDYRWQFLFEKK